MRLYNYIKEGILTAGLAEAAVFIFQDYNKKYMKWIPKAFQGAKKPPLLPIIKAVTKKFNSYENIESQFTIDKLTDYYIDYQLKDYKGKPTPEAKRMHIESYGLDTLPPKYKSKIDKFIG
jgi:hypothetical protein